MIAGSSVVFGDFCVSVSFIVEILVLKLSIGNHLMLQYCLCAVLTMITKTKSDNGLPSLIPLVICENR